MLKITCYADGKSKIRKFNTPYLAYQYVETQILNKHIKKIEILKGETPCNFKQ